MAVNQIVLDKPLGTDIYNVGVFNANSTVIENNLNKLLRDVAEIQEILPGKLDYRKVSNLDLDTITGDAIYFVNGNLSGDLPATNLATSGHVVICYQDGSKKIIILFTSDGRLYFKNTLNGKWISSTPSLTDDLDTGDPDSAMSAAAGKWLKDHKLSLFRPTEEDALDINNLECGAYVVHSLNNLEGDLPVVMDYTEKDFTILSLGERDKVCAQVIWSSQYGIAYTRTGHVNEETNEFEYTDWRSLMGGGSSGGGGGGASDEEIIAMQNQLRELQKTVKELQTIIESGGSGGTGSSCGCKFAVVPEDYVYNPDDFPNTKPDDPNPPVAVALSMGTVNDRVATSELEKVTTLNMGVTEREGNTVVSGGTEVVDTSTFNIETVEQ